MSEWIKCSERMPEQHQIVDIWVPGYFPARMCNYRLMKNYGGRKGNDFFAPESSGYTCIRTASHWMPAPEPPQD